MQLEGPVADLCVVQQIVDQGREQGGVLEDDLDRFLDFGWDGLVEERFQVHVNCVEGYAQVVRHIGQHLILVLVQHLQLLLVRLIRQVRDNHHHGSVLVPDAVRERHVVKEFLGLVIGAVAVVVDLLVVVAALVHLARGLGFLGGQAGVQRDHQLIELRSHELKERFFGPVVHLEVEIC